MDSLYTTIYMQLIHVVFSFLYSRFILAISKRNFTCRNLTPAVVEYKEVVKQDCISTYSNYPTPPPPHPTPLINNKYM